MSPRERQNSGKKPLTLGAVLHGVDQDKAGAKYEEKKHDKNPTFSDLVDPQKPWVLVPGGSLHGFFDFVPERLRSGPWSICARLYLPVMTCAILFLIGGLPY